MGGLRVLVCLLRLLLKQDTVTTTATTMAIIGTVDSGISRRKFIDTELLSLPGYVKKSHSQKTVESLNAYHHCQ